MRGALGRAAGRHHGGDARPAVRRDGQPLAALPDRVLPAVGQGRLLPGRWRHRLSRPAAGRDGADLGRAATCCASRSCCAPRASSPRATCSTGGTRPAAPACARISPTTCCGCRYACAHYLRATGDAAAARRDACPSSKARRSPTAPKTPTTRRASATQQASVYEHAARAIDRSLRVGVHGLPLMGSGDWNDGMNRVGHRRPRRIGLAGAGSCARVVADFAPLARAARRRRRAPSAGRRARAGLAAPRCSGEAWDGDWFKRAFFDDGSAARLARQPRGAHRPDRAGLGGAVGRGAGRRCSGRRWRRSRRTWSTTQAGLIQLLRPAAGARASRAPATSRPTRRACAKTAASTRTPASGP